MKYLLVLIVVGVGLWMLWARVRQGRGQADQAASSDEKTPAPSSAEVPQTMVACRHCGLHLPTREAVFRDTVPYCSAAHLQAGPR